MHLAFLFENLYFLFQIHDGKGRRGETLFWKHSVLLEPGIIFFDLSHFIQTIFHLLNPETRFQSSKCKNEWRPEERLNVFCEILVFSHFRVKYGWMVGWKWVVWRDKDEDEGDVRCVMRCENARSSEYTSWNFFLPRTNLVPSQN